MNMRVMRSGRWISVYLNSALDDELFREGWLLENCSFINLKFQSRSMIKIPKKLRISFDFAFRNGDRNKHLFCFNLALQSARRGIHATKQTEVCK